MMFADAKKRRSRKKVKRRAAVKPDCFLDFPEAPVTAFLQQVGDSPEIFLLPSNEVAKLALGSLKGLFDYAKCTEVVEGTGGPLDALVTEQMDVEQIWGQVELQNSSLVPFFEERLQELEALEVDPNTDAVDSQEADSTAQEGGEEGEEQQLARTAEAEDESVSSKAVDSEVSFDKSMELASDGELEDFKEDEEEPEGEDEEEEDREREAEADAEADAEEESERSPEDRDLRSVASEESTRDLFFNMAEMEKFLEQAEEEEERRRLREQRLASREHMSGDEDEDEEEDEDDALLELEAADEADADGINPAEIMYEDFFGPRHLPRRSESAEEEDTHQDGAATAQRKRRRDEEERADVAEEESEDEGEEEEESSPDEQSSEKPQHLSRYEQEKLQLQEKIQKLQEISIADKPWTLLGEVSSTKRPVGSLLEVDLDFDYATKPAPVITPEVTASLEEIIKRRIKEESWDDPVRKVELDRPFKPQVVLDEEKSKKGLGEIYEEEYLRQTAGVEKADEVDEKRNEIAVMFKKLCYKLDALSNFHYTPKPPKEITEVKANVPAIRMEEVTPVAVSSADLLAPTEVYQKMEKPIRGKTELTKEDRKRLRRQKKEKKKKEKKRKEEEKKARERAHPELKKPDSEKAIASQLKHSKNVTIAKKAGVPGKTKGAAFFKRLEEDARKTISAEKQKAKAADGRDPFKSQASFLKL